MDSTADSTAIATALTAEGLAAPLAHELAALALPAIFAQSTPLTGTPSAGGSRLGGAPDLPPGTSWPTHTGAPLAFIAQIRLEEVAPYDVAHLLPSNGMLWFFYDAQQQTYGDDPASRGAWQVIYAPSAEGLQATPLPDALPPEARYTACALTFSTILTLPQDPSAERPGVPLSGPDQEKYEAVLASYPQPAHHSEPRHQLLGYPDTLQDDMRMECQLAAHGLPVDGSDPRTAALAPGAANWQLLFQVDSDAQAGMRWADAGMLYYWIERDALRQHQFEATWVVLQSD